MATTMVHSKEIKKKKSHYSRKYNGQFTDDEVDIINNLENLKKDLDFLYSSLDYVTDPLLIDGYIYEIKAVQMKYQYYLNLCKEFGMNKAFA